MLLIKTNQKPVVKSRLKLVTRLIKSVVTWKNTPRDCEEKKHKKLNIIIDIMEEDHMRMA